MAKHPKGANSFCGVPFDILGVSALLRVVVANESEIVRAHLVSLLSALANVSVVGLAEGAQQTLQSVRDLHPDVVITDPRMPGGQGQNLLRHMKQSHTSLVVIVLNGESSARGRRGSRRAGADFSLPKSDAPTKLLEILRGLSEHESFYGRRKP